MMTAVVDKPVLEAETTGPVLTIPVGVNLLPDEIVAARRGKRMRTYVAGALIVVVGLLAGWYVLAATGASSAQVQLNREQSRTQQLLSQQNSFGTLVTTQAQAAGIEKQLATLTSHDLDWTTMLSSIRRAAGSGVKFTAITGTVTQPGATSTAGTAATATLPVVGTQVGTLVITGDVRDPRTLAAFVDRLATIKGLSTPIPASAADTTGTLTFTVNAAITDSALGSRFSKGTK